MPSGPRKKRAQKKKNEAAAKEKSENEAKLIASSKEHSPVMQTESTDGVIAVFDEPTVVLPRSTILLENIVASEVLDFKRKDTEEGIKENAVPIEIYSSDQSLDVAGVKEPLETGLVDKLNMAGESSAVAAPCVILLDSEDEDGGSKMSPDVFEENEAEGIIEIPMPTELYSSVLVSQPNVTGPTNVTDAVATDATKLSQVDDGGSILDSDKAAFSVIMDNIAALTIKACDLDLGSVDCLNAEIAVFTDGLIAEENQETALVDEVDTVDIMNQTHDAVSIEPVTPEVGKQLKEIKEMVEDVLNRLNAIDAALLHRN